MQKSQRTTSPLERFQIAVWWSCQIAPRSHSLQRHILGISLPACHSTGQHVPMCLGFCINHCLISKGMLRLVDLGGRESKSASPYVFHPALPHVMENMLSFFICCGSEPFLAKPMAFFTGPVLQKVRQRGEGCSMKGSYFSLIYCQCTHVFAGWTVPQWTALLLHLMAWRVLFLFSLFSDLDLGNSSYWCKSRLTDLASSGPPALPLSAWAEKNSQTLGAALCWHQQ